MVVELAGNANGVHRSVHLEAQDNRVYVEVVALANVDGTNAGSQFLLHRLYFTAHGHGF
jgi:hypothetical protein